jgi:hypothetical protein
VPAYNAVAFLFDFVIGAGLALFIYALLRRSLRELLTNSLRIPEATNFYLRSLVLVLLSGALAKVVTGIHMKPEAHFMEYVWAIASDIGGVFDNLSLILLAYLTLVTVLVAVLRPRNGK